ncbi:ATPase [Methanobrevibacter sp.]|uniref:ATPase n=1 Tax=Methanobrevibacter sp. TaxID=66852 RepID=UPI0038635958
MECYYHPDRESINKCAVCGKSICEECGIQIAGKIYCKECLEKIVGVGVAESAPVAQEPVEAEPVRLNPQRPTEDAVQQKDQIDFETPYAPQEEIAPAPEIKGISEDSPYNIRSNIEYSGGLESSYLDDVEKTYQTPQEEQPQIAQNESTIPEQAVTKTEDDFIYPDHSYQPEPTSARQDLEDKYEKYLDDLYFDEVDIPLGEQLAKDEAIYGSLTKKEYVPKPKEVEEPKIPEEEPAPKEKVSKRRLLRRKEKPKMEAPEAEAPKVEAIKEKAPKAETPEEMEARIRAEILKEHGLLDEKGEGNIHNLNYQDQKEPMGIIDILLSIILIIVVLIVLYYLAYLFLLSSNYPTFLDALFALKNPQNVINAILTH